MRTGWMLMFQLIDSYSRGRGDYPKTQGLFLKVEVNTQYEIINNSEVVSGNDYMVYSDVKVENENHLKLVFGQSVGVTCMIVLDYMRKNRMS